MPRCVQWVLITTHCRLCFKVRHNVTGKNDVSSRGSMKLFTLFTIAGILLFPVTVQPAVADLRSTIASTRNVTSNICRFRVPHFALVRQSLIFETRTASGVFAQLEYATPYGPLRLVEFPVMKTDPRWSESRPSIESRKIVGVGTTPSGVPWSVERIGSKQHLEMQFNDCFVTAWLPAEMNINSISRLVGGIY
jgi:hypothetical protein